jgi:hypothetical protein
MKRSEKVVIWIGAFLFAFLGYFVMQIINDFLWDVFTNLNINFLSPTRMGNLSYAISWFGLSVIIYWITTNDQATRWLESGDNFSIHHLTFIASWLISAIGILLAFQIYILFQEVPIEFQLDNFLDIYITVLTLALIPSLAINLGVNTKACS